MHDLRGLCSSNPVTSLPPSTHTLGLACLGLYFAVALTESGLPSGAEACILRCVCVSARLFVRRSGGSLCFGWHTFSRCEHGLGGKCICRKLCSVLAQFVVEGENQTNLGLYSH